MHIHMEPVNNENGKKKQTDGVEWFQDGVEWF